MLPEIVLKRVHAQIFLVETLQVSMNGSSADYPLLVKLVINTLKQCLQVCDGLPTDAFVAAQEVGFDNLCETIDGRSCGIETLINHRRGWFVLD